MLTVYVNNAFSPVAHIISPDKRRSESPAHLNHWLIEPISAYKSLETISIVDIHFLLLFPPISSSFLLSITDAEFPIILD